MAPNIPVIMITATVIVTYPPRIELTSIPMAVVIDLGSRVTNSSCDKLKILASIKIDTKEVSTPEDIPTQIANQFFLSKVICS